MGSILDQGDLELIAPPPQLGHTIGKPVDIGRQHGVEV
jgi:hypothetical protein